MNLHRLYCFTKVVEEGSISNAAKTLNMTQPPLSMLIKKLETELDVILFERRGKRLILKDTGELLYTRAKELLALTEEITQEVTEQQEGLRGTVRVGCSTIANLTILPNVVEQLREGSLNIVIEVREGNSSYVINQLRGNKLDVGIVRNVFHADDLNFNTLFSEPLYLAVPPNHSLLDKKAVTLADLKNENFLLQATTVGRNISDVIIEACHANHFTPNVIYWGTDTLPMLSMVRKGLGIAFVPKVFMNLTEFELPPIIKFDTPSLFTNLTIITAKDRFTTAATKRFLKVTEDIVLDLHHNET